MLHNTNTLIMKGVTNMKSYFKKYPLALVASLILITPGCSKQASAPTQLSSSKEDTTTQSSEGKQS